MHHVEEGRDGRIWIGLAGQHVEVRRQGVVVGGQRRLAAAERPLVDQRQSQLCGRLDDLLGALDVRHARQLDQDLIGGGIALDYRLADAELVDAAVDGAHGLLDDLVAAIGRDLRILGLDAQHQLHAAIQIETELEGILHRIDDPQAQGDDTDDDEHAVAGARADKRTHDCSNPKKDTLRLPAACRTGGLP